MAPVAPYGHKVPCLTGGPGAEALLPRARALGMKMEFVSAEVGQASAIKMFRSIMIKGLEALVLESMLAASEYRVGGRGGGGGGKRGGGAKPRGSIGIEPIRAAAPAARQQWLADLGVKERMS